MYKSFSCFASAPVFDIVRVFFVFVFVFFSFSHSDRYMVGSHYGLNSHFPSE